VAFPIETHRLILRPFRIDDAAAMFRVWGDAEVMRYIPRGPYASVEELPPRLERLARFHEQKGLSLWAVCLREPTEEGMWDTPIGSAGLTPVAWAGPEVEVAYHFAREYWGHGFASEAAGACLAYGFTELELPKIIGLTFKENLASQRVLEKIGMTLVGPTSDYYGMSLLKWEKLREED
jgi:RimJ/RimL family protein N-acetyltransferase